MEEKPFIGPEQNIPEMTWLALVLGAILAIVLGAANTYLGLYAGMTVSASIPAAVISMGLLRGILKRGTILENNIVQTMASTGESLAAGIIFTLPALIIAGVWSKFDYWTVTLVALFGGILGIIFMIPMRRSLVIEEKTLKYPEGTACAEVLKAGEGARVGMKEIMQGMFIGGFLKFFISGVGLFKGTVEFASRIGSSIFYVGSDVSAALLGVGVIVGFNIGVLMFIGGALGWLVGIPLVGAIKGFPEGAALDSAWDLWSSQIRYIGVGAMVVSGVWSIIKIRKGIAAGFMEVFNAYNKSTKEKPVRTELNMATNHIALIVLATIISLLIFYYMNLHSLSITVVSVITILVLSFFLVAVASYICGLVGSSNSPVSGMTICALLVTALILYLMGAKGTFAILATLLVSGVICCATCTSGDISQDLRTGVLVGATPRSQQWAEIIGAVIPAFFFAPILILLHNAYGIGTDAPGALKAPQAALFASLSEALFGDKKMPWDMVITGIVLAIVIIFIDEILEKKGTSFRLYSMPVAVGIYLPFSLSIPILAGGIIQFLLARSQKKNKTSAENQNSVLLSSGLIAGEALMGIFLALVISLISYYKWEYELPLTMPIPDWSIVILTLIAFIGLFFFVLNKGKEEKSLG